MHKPDADELLMAIAEDRAHGADYLGDRAIEALGRFAETHPAVTVEELRCALWGYAGTLARVRPSMAPLTNKVAAVMSELPVNGTLGGLRVAVADASKRILSESASRRRRLVGFAAEALKDARCVFTYSSSSTVMDVLQALGPRRVIVTEGRPLYEGRGVASQLESQGFNVTLIIDAAAAMYVGEADAILVGADSVLHGGGFVNKVGSRLLALAARERGVPFYVVADTMKLDVAHYLGRGLDLEEKEPEEVWDAPMGVHVANPYFEETPGSLVTLYVTERGPMGPGELLAIFEEMAPTVEPLIR
jgi:ribose 1,5-bisphosphate isomerase